MKNLGERLGLIGRFGQGDGLGKELKTTHRKWFICFKPLKSALTRFSVVSVEKRSDPFFQRKAIPSTWTHRS